VAVVAVQRVSACQRTDFVDSTVAVVVEALRLRTQPPIPLTKHSATMAVLATVSHLTLVVVVVAMQVQAELRQATPWVEQVATV
jgi:hypothetical protein